MQTQIENQLWDTSSIDAGLERLQRDLADTPKSGSGAGVTGEIDFSDRDPIDFASVEFEVERMRKRLAIWDIFLGYMGDGARTWSEVQRAVTPEDLEEIVTICDGVPLRDVLLDLR